MLRFMYEDGVRLGSRVRGTLELLGSFCVYLSVYVYVQNIYIYISKHVKLMDYGIIVCID